MIVFGMLVLLVVLVALMIRLRDAERRSFLMCLTAAAERGIPLDQASLALSNEQGVEWGNRAGRIGRLLAGGMPLSDVISHLWSRIPYDLLLAIRLGTRTGDLGVAMRQISRLDKESENLLRSVLDNLFYVAVLAGVLTSILTFLMLKIVPVFDHMFREFDLQLPDMTRMVIFVSYYVVHYWFLAAPLFLAMQIAFALAVLYNLNLLPRDVPLLNRLSLRWDSALIMRSLALAVRQSRPLENMIGILSEEYPRASVRLRLTRSLDRMARGEPWAAALRRTGIFGAAEEQLALASQRSGNLEWAFQEMADSTLRRMTLRLRLVLTLGIPILLAGFGCVIAFFVIGLFIPLVSLIQGLS